jgi:cobalt-zinc-cadmium efflux system protein
VAHIHAHTATHGTYAALAERRADSGRRMSIALAINLALLVAEAVGGVITGSLALLADAGHVLSDAGAIALGLSAARLAARRTGSRRTFGLQRAEVLAGLVNGIALAVIAILIAIEAVGRISDPVELDAAPVLVLGAVGLAGNLVATWVLAGGERSDINLEGVLRHSFADALGSLGVIVSAVLILVAGLEVADPVASLLISALVLVSSWRLITEPVNVLMEAAPEGLDVGELGAELCAVEDVRGVHDLHVWTVTAGFDALAAHVVIRRGADRDLVRLRLEQLLHERFGIEHTTLQIVEEADEGLLQVEGA